MIRARGVRVIAVSRLTRFHAVHQISYLSRITVGRIRVTFITYHFELVRFFMSVLRHSDVANEKKNEEVFAALLKYDPRLVPSARLRTRCRIDFDNSGFTWRSYREQSEALKIPHATACKLTMQIYHLNLAT